MNIPLVLPDIHPLVVSMHADSLSDASPVANKAKSREKRTPKQTKPTEKQDKHNRPLLKSIKEIKRTRDKLTEQSSRSIAISTREPICSF